MDQYNITLWALAFVFTITYAQTLPYNPTNILLSSSSSKNKDIAYVFLQNSDSNAANQLLALNISSTISASNITFEILDPALPFQTDGSEAFLPSISSSGEVLVYSGSCSTSTSAQLWIFSPNYTSSTGNGTWERKTTTKASDVISADLPGANFLSRAFTFSALVHSNASQTQLYVFGGMCPKSGAAASTWQSAASYSNHILRLSPEDSTSYELDVPSSRGPPIAEAGFTITGLTPTYSNGSVETQQQTFVLLGGHTQQAFINMSQVAIWSLPEEAWSFVTIDSPQSSPNTELAAKSVATSVDSRSGHTAVLTTDGSQMIVYGGWVGDITQAADPQLAILELGAGFGGSGDWSWTIPEKQPSGTGIYGHGAVMLPGNVMMVLGGYNISASGNSKRDSSTANNAMFFNVTSSTWMADYTNPAYIAAVASTAHASHSSKSNRKNIGLGVGLGLGLAAVLIAALIFFWYNRRLRQRRVEEREKHIQSLSAGQAHFYSPTREMGQRSGGFPWTNNRWNRDNNDPEVIYDSTSAVAGYENLHAGVHGLGDRGIPPAPKHIQRKPLHSRNARGLYQPTSAFESPNHGRSNSLGTAGPIHPIYEADEEDHNSQVQDNEVGVALGDPSSAPTSAKPTRHSDPFRDPPINFSAPLHDEGRRIPTPDGESPARSREREIQEWVSDWAAADALLASQAKFHSSAGRVSPTRRAQLIGASSVSSISGEEDSGRTASNLSERSVAISAMTVSRSGSSSQSRSRSNSLRGFITNTINPFASTLLSTTVGSSTMSPVFDTSSRGQPPRSAGGSTISFATAHSTFPSLQAEGESLLPRPEGEYGSENVSDRSSPDSGSPSKSKPSPLGAGRIGWLGSLRKAFVSDSPNGNHSPEANTFGTRTPSPVRNSEGMTAAVEPRRAISASATLWRRKQGKSDWDDSADLDSRTPPTAQRSNTFTGDMQNAASGSRSLDNPDDDEEWDIERAVENRVVQVMFTVPKEKLRVVNHNFDDDMSETGSLRSKKGSNRSLRVVEPLVAVDENPREAEPEAEVEADRKAKGKAKEVGRVQEIVQNLEKKVGSPERS